MFPLLFLVLTVSAYSAQAYQGSMNKMEGFYPKLFKIYAPNEVMTLEGPGKYYNSNTSSQAGYGACDIQIDNGDWVAAVSSEIFGSGRRPRSSKMCNQCIKVYTIRQTFNVRVVEKCTTCKSGDLALSPNPFKLAVGNLVPPYPILAWDLAPDSECRPAKPTLENSIPGLETFPTFLPQVTVRPRLRPSFTPLPSYPPPPFFVPAPPQITKLQPIPTYVRPQRPIGYGPWIVPASDVGTNDSRIQLLSSSDASNSTSSNSTFALTEATSGGSSISHTFAVFAFSVLLFYFAS